MLRNDIPSTSWDLTSPSPIYALDAGDLNKDSNVMFKPINNTKAEQLWTYQEDKRISVKVNETSNRCLTWDRKGNYSVITTPCKEGPQVPEDSEDPSTFWRQLWNITPEGKD
ncbi:uncharacterized protein I206_103723 [Kwoniella pini CBS 10737]|uniref:Ricin B lectin domain-containing protein n=1 Tax=Kwoniella pini CBS 10737 TaxID=1296096 RepID=A0A1B9I8S0_9TREE|nr:uncharacterized protein I206_01276 [Kwoniella pini CBS 10737]OCF51992.1 hypothetical protein I206_01276 [Kwoniella pini CBS 10737]